MPITPHGIMQTGGCQCGAVRYDVTGKPRALYVCHCRECQKQSASAFGISVIMNSADVHLRQGELHHWSRATDSGRRLDCFFCPRCGTRLWHGDKARDPTISVKGGAPDQPVDLSHAIHIWTSRKLAGLCIPDGATHYPEEPPDDR